jgi:hypothetical protein
MVCRRGKETGAWVAPVSGGPSDRKAKNLRAPELVRELYREGPLPQTYASHPSQLLVVLTLLPT